MSLPSSSSESHQLPEVPPPAPFIAHAKAYAVHVLTASGIVCAFFAAAELCKPEPSAKVVFAFLALQVLIDAADGPMARAWNVKRYAARIDGRTIDDIVDYLTYTFVPLMLIWRLGWVPAPAELWVSLAMVASLFGFANSGAKDERGGWFLGFPSYWNIVAFYLGLIFVRFGPWPGAILVVSLTILTVCPVRFLYPNLAPKPWRWPILVGALIWLVQLGAMFPAYPNPPAWMLWTSLIYPTFYVVMSLALNRSPARGRDAKTV